MMAQDGTGPNGRRRRIAVVGGGISGLGAAWLLSRRHDVVLFEADRILGGHARTIVVEAKGRPMPVDTGFIVFNRVNYPHLCGLFAALDVPVRTSDMSFAVSVDDGAIEYGCRNLRAAFAQGRNGIRPAFWRMFRDIMVFNRKALAVADRDHALSVDGLLRHLKLGPWFSQYYLLAMSGAIWSTSRGRMREFPAGVLARFFDNHGLLSLYGQHQWWTVAGGSQVYVRRMAATMAAEIRLDSPVSAVVRHPDGVDLHAARCGPERFDDVVMACHADTTLALLSDADTVERRILGPIRFRSNRAVLHGDPGQMPKRKACWSSWVYRARSDMREPEASVTYWMNALQGIPEATPLFVTLNPSDALARETVLDEHTVRHPQFDFAAIAAQEAVPSIQGYRGVWYCGAWTRNGFHEDGLASAVAVARRFGIAPPWAC